MDEAGSLRAWIGREAEARDGLPPWPAVALSAVLRDEAREWRSGEALPPLWHWAYFLGAAPQGQLGPDGHPARGGFLPPVPLQRRLWAGSRLEFFEPLRLGEPARRLSRVADVRATEGRSGPLVFVQVAHEVYGPAGRLALRDMHDIVYRQPPKPGDAARAEPAPAHAAWRETRIPDAVLLFRFSALTFNGHRIHYDHLYATQVEGYAGLVVHGPLIATLLLEAAQRRHPGLAVRAYEFRAVRPLIADQALVLCGAECADDGTVRLWAEDGEGRLLMQAGARFQAS